MFDGVQNFPLFIGYHVPWDIKSELSSSAATAQIGAIVSSWLSVLFLGASNAPRASSSLLNAVQQSVPMLKPFLAAYELQQEWCADWQLYVANEETGRVRVANLTVVNNLVELAFAHTSYSVESNILEVKDVVYYEPDVLDFKGNIAGALQIACKAISRARVNSILKNGANQTEPSCRELNEQAIAAAYSYLNASWPQALIRNAKFGGGFVLQDDKMVGSGPVWVAEGLQFARQNGSRDATVVSVGIVTSLSSFIFPGSHYCKLLSPARAVEWLQTISLTNRYGNSF